MRKTVSLEGDPALVKQFSGKIKIPRACTARRISLARPPKGPDSDGYGEFGILGDTVHVQIGKNLSVKEINNFLKESYQPEPDRPEPSLAEIRQENKRKYQAKKKKLREKSKK